MLFQKVERMILLRNEECTIDAFQFDQFGGGGESPKKPEEDITFPDFEEESMAEAAEEIGQEEDEVALPQEENNALLLKEFEKREAEFLEKEKEVLAKAQKQAEEIRQQAEAEAEELKKTAFTQASEDGYQEGYQRAYQEHKEKFDEETAVFLLQVRDVMEAYENEKNLLISKNIEELRDLSVAIAEKVIQVSLKTSGEIIKKMIVTATSKMKSKEWAKIYLSKNDASLIIESDADLIDAISHLSEHIKIVVMEDSAPGTCIIELPDQIIDASASTQIENIRTIMKSSGRLGGNPGV